MDMKVVLNAKMEDIAGKISIKNLGIFGIYATYDLVASTTADNRLYEVDVPSQVWPDVPCKILNNIKKIEVKIDGSNWTTIRLRDMNDIPDFVFQESWITNNYSSVKPEAIIYGGKIMILSGTLSYVNRGLRVWFTSFPRPVPTMAGSTDLSVYTDPKGMASPNGTFTYSVGFPMQLHELLAEKMVIEYKEQNEILLTFNERRHELRLKEKLDALTPQSWDEGFQANIPYDDGSDY